jgi:hypothetical protein
MNLRALSLVAMSVAVASAAGACGGKKDDGAVNKALAELATCKDERDRAKSAADACTKQFAEYKAMTPSGPQEILVRIDGEGLTIVGKLPRGGGEQMVGAGDLTEAEKNVVPLVIAQIAGSRSAIQQCYVQALKTTAGLENRSINLTVTVKVSPTGAISNAQFSPQISQQFDGCMSTVAAKWKIGPYQGRAFPLQYPLKLTPVN